MPRLLPRSRRRGPRYEFSAHIAGWISGVPTDALDTARLELEFFDDGGNSIGIDAVLDGVTGGADGLTNTWDFFSASGVIPLNAEEAVVRTHQAVRVRPEAPDGFRNGNDNYVDLVSLTVPEPTSAAVFGLGIGVLPRRRRR